MPKKKLNTYTSEFKESAVKLTLDSNESIPHIAEDLGINPNTLYTWVHNASKSKENNNVTKKEGRECYGTRRIQQDLIAQELTVSRRRIGRSLNGD